MRKPNALEVCPMCDRPHGAGRVVHAVCVGAVTLVVLLVAAAIASGLLWVVVEILRALGR